MSDEWQDLVAERTAKSSEAITKVRLQFDFTPGSVKALKALVVDTEAASMAEVVRDALAVHQLVGPAMRRGASVIVREADGSESRIVLARR